MDLNPHIFENFETIKTIDSFIYRFSEIQDYMGEKFFPAVLDNLDEYKSFLSFKDILNKLEKLELLESAAQWMSYREIKNTLTHEYPDNENDIIEGIKLAVNAYEKITKIYEIIRKKF